MQTYRIGPLVLVAALAAGAGASEAQSFNRSGNPPTKTTGQVAAHAFLAAQTISQSTSTTVVAAASISCNSSSPNFYHMDNSYYRGFTLSGFAALTLPEFLVQQVTVGIEQATAATPPQAMTVRIWKATANPINGAADPPGANQVASEAVSVANQTLSLLPVNLTTPPVFLVASEHLAVEVFTPTGQTLLNTFFIGSNASGQSGPGYIKAAACGVSTITTLAGVSYPNMHIVMQVTGNNQTPVELQNFSIE